MGNVPVLSGKEIVTVLKHLGFVPVRQRGSHVVMRREEGRRVDVCVVPMHREIAKGTLRGVLKQADVSMEEFLAALHDRKRDI